jgi:pimeloyl-ACP methyl ester carboxylesterase
MTRKRFLGLSAAGFHSVSYAEWGDPHAQHVVICAHGLTRNARDFDALAHALETRARVICPDVVGRGQSAWLSRAQDYSYPQYLSDVTALIARVTADCGPDAKIDWVGTSMGGLIGMLLAAMPGNPLRRMVMNDVGPVIPKAALERIAMYVGKAPRFGSMAEAERYVRSVSTSFGAHTDRQWRHLTEHNTRVENDGGIRMNYDPGIAVAFSATPLEDVVLWESWDRIRCPVLILRGAESDLLLPEIAQEMLRRGPPARLVEFPGVGHAPTLMSAAQIEPVCEFLLAP